MKLPIDLYASIPVGDIVIKRKLSNVSATGKPLFSLEGNTFINKVVFNNVRIMRLITFRAAFTAQQIIWRYFVCMTARDSFYECLFPRTKVIS